MNTYVCLYKYKRVEVQAETTYQAQQKAAVLLKPKKAYEITVALAEVNGTPYVHTAVD